MTTYTIVLPHTFTHISANLVTVSVCTMKNDKSFCIYLPEKFHIILVPFHRMQCFPIHIIFTWYFDFVSEVDNVRHLNIYMECIWRENEKKCGTEKWVYVFIKFLWFFTAEHIRFAFFLLSFALIFCNCLREKNHSICPLSICIYFKLHFQYLPVKCIPWIVWQPTENKYRKNVLVLNWSVHILIHKVRMWKWTSEKVLSSERRGRRKW